MPAKQQVSGQALIPTEGQPLMPQGEPIALANIQDALIIKENNVFLMTDQEGNLPPDSCEGYGLYKDDTRYLSVYDFSFGKTRPTVLLSTADLGYSSEHHLTNLTMTAVDGTTLPKESLEVTRQRIINESLHETIQMTNFSILRAVVNLCFDFDADFRDIFEVRGERRPRRGELTAPIVEKDRVIFRYKGLDGVRRSTQIRFSPAPDQLWHNGARFTIGLGHRESASITVTVALDDALGDGPFATELETLSASYRNWLHSSTQVFTSNEFFNAMLERSLSDLRLLTINSNGGFFVAAGTPWFNCLFGRDSLITSFQALAFNPGIARNTLQILAQWQGKEVNDWRDEEPGKILHELRLGEMACVGEIPMHPYYGSIDSTPLFLMLAAEYVAWTGDLELVRQLEPNLVAALHWIDSYGDRDGQGYVQYAKRSPKGLLNQGWKDSHNGIINRDGTLVEPPIALAEVQGYVYAAKRGLAWLFSLLERDGLSRRLRRDAAALNANFNRDFWLEDEQFYAMALGANGLPAASISSNPGQCLWTGIVDVDKAPKVVERLFANDMFSGWGIRTLSSRSVRYNPLGYHLGTVWPHDNSIISMGLKRYGFEEELNELATALYDCCRTFDYYRLPELFSGLPRTFHNLPVHYPVACRPQAWASGTLPFFLQAILGLAPNAPENRLRIIRPSLPYWLEEVEVRGLRVGNSQVDLLYQRRKGHTRVSVTGNEGGVRVSLARK